MVSFFSRPIFFRSLWSWAESFDLSQLEILAFSMSSSVPGARFLHCLVRGAMEGSSAEKQGEEGQCVREELEKQQWWREREELCGVAKGMNEE
jgi:hypothetical protein